MNEFFNEWIHRRVNTEEALIDGEEGGKPPAPNEVALKIGIHWYLKVQFAVYLYIFILILKSFKFPSLSGIIHFRKKIFAIFQRLKID